MKKVSDIKLKLLLIEQSNYKSHFTFDPVYDTELFFVSEDEYIISEGRRPEYLFFLCSGRAKIFMTLPNGRITLIDFASSPSFIGEMELLYENREVRAVQATENCYLLGLPLKRYRNKLLNDINFMQSICRQLGDKNHRRMIISSRNQTFPLANRLALFILFTAKGNIYAEKHTQTADYLGVTYRHLLYVLASMVKKGYIKKATPKGYIITDRKSLEELAYAMKVKGPIF